MGPNKLVPYLSGHTTKSTTDPPATTYIVTGAAGNHENHEPLVLPAPERVALRLNDYGYSRMYVHNDTHLRWMQVVTDGSHDPPMYDVVKDDVWIVQHKHG